MNNKFTKNDLKTGDIIETRSGELGIVIAEKELIIYQNSGSDFYDCFTDDLLADDDFNDWDIVKVYACNGGSIDFNDYNSVIPVFEREN